MANIPMLFNGIYLVCVMLLKTDFMVEFSS